MIENLPSQVKVHQLLRKKNRSKSENEELILAIKKGAYDMPDVSFALTYELQKQKNNTSDQKYINLEEMILNGIKIKIPITTIRKYLQYFAKEIGKTKYLQKLAAFLSFSYDKDNRRELQTIAKQDASDLQTKKRILTSYKIQGKIDEYIKKLNSFLEDNPSDTESWVELSQIYTERGLYLRALYCLEEVIVIHPEIDHYTVKLAQLYVTMGGKQNLSHAVKYYSHVISRAPKNMRALWGLFRTIQSMGDNITSELAELKSLCKDTIHNQYSKRNSDLKIHVAI